MYPTTKDIGTENSCIILRYFTKKTNDDKDKALSDCLLTLTVTL